MDVGLVCDACTALTPIGVPQCKRCGAPVALEPGRARGASRPPPPASDSPALAVTLPPPGLDIVECGKCGTEVSPNTRFCPNCGAKIAEPQFESTTRVGPRAVATAAQPAPATSKVGRSTLFFGGAVQAARAKLTLIRGDGEDGVSFTLAGIEHQAGRGDVPISFPDDPFLSPTHANFIYRAEQAQLTVRDEGSLNGVFVRLAGASELALGATILVGEQVLTITQASQPDDAPDLEGTYFSASMPRSATLEIRQALRGGQPGWVFRPRGEVVTIGREGNEINFPEDPFISGHHAEVRLSGGAASPGSGLVVTDLGSRNGTFIRVNGERVLKHGDYVFLGQQLLRVEIV